MSNVGHVAKADRVFHIVTAESRLESPWVNDSSELSKSLATMTQSARS